MGKTASKPTKLKALEGNRGRRPLPENEPEPDNIIPDMPKTIDTDAQKTWKKLAPMLKRIGLVTEADGDMLAALCQIQARLSQIHAEMKSANSEIVKLNRAYRKAIKAKELDEATEFLNMAEVQDTKKVLTILREQKKS